jgi:hypothetical protein
MFDENNKEILFFYFILSPVIGDDLPFAMTGMDEVYSLFE